MVVGSSLAATGLLVLKGLALGNRVYTYVCLSKLDGRGTTSALIQPFDLFHDPVCARLYRPCFRLV